MRLYEEYLNRHHIHDVPLIHHAGNTCIVFKTKDYKVWSDILQKDISSSTNFNAPTTGLFVSKWLHNDHHPGHYEINVYYQLHDGFHVDQVLTGCHVSNIKWHEYENFISIYAYKLSKTDIIRDRDAAFIAGWEMFVSAYDGWFARQGGDIKYMLFQSLDADSPSHIRMDYIAEILKKLSPYNAGLIRNWKYEVLNKVQYHADWLVNVVDSYAKELLPCKN